MDDETCSRTITEEKNQSKAQRNSHYDVIAALARDTADVNCLLRLKLKLKEKTITDLLP